MTKNLIQGLVSSGLFDIDILCKKSSLEDIEGINSITVIKNSKTFVDDVFEEIKDGHYDYILSSDILVPFANNLLHSTSARYKSKNGKNKIEQLFLNFYNLRKVKRQEKCLAHCKKAIFTVSDRLKDDYVENYNLDSNKVFACHPAVDQSSNQGQFIKNSEFTIGSIVGGGFNKGGYLLARAMKSLPRNSKIKGKLIFPKIKKAIIYKTFIKILGVEDRIEIIPKQEDMESFYKSIDCYVLPSLNEAFGLVVTEAASNFKPTILSSTAGARELIVDGENGFVFDRTEKPVKNLSEKLIEISNLYFNNYQKYTEISMNAKKMSEQLDWKKFTDIIIDNMIGENESDKEKFIQKSSV